MPKKTAPEDPEESDDDEDTPNPVGPDEDDDDDEEGPDVDDERKPSHPDITDLLEQTRDALKQQREETAALRAEVQTMKQSAVAGAKAEATLAEIQAKVAVPRAEPVAVAAAPAAASSPSVPRPSVPMKDRERYKGVPEDEKVTLSETDLADIEADLRRGVRLSECLESIGAPVNRFTLDQARRISRTLQNRGEAPASGAPKGLMGSVKEIQDFIEPLQKLGLIYTRADMDKVMKDHEPEADPETEELKQIVSGSKDIILEVVEAARDITGHPKRGGRIAGELTEKTAHHQLTAGETPERRALTGSVQAQPAVPSVGAGMAEVASGGTQQRASSIAMTHPELFTTWEYIVQLAPRIHDLEMQDGDPQTVRDNAIKDATLAANAAWMLVRDKKPTHVFDSNSGRCLRCNVAQEPAAMGKPCPKGMSQKDMLRGLRGMSVKGLLENIEAYQGTLELNTPLDALGGLSLRQYMFSKKFGPSDVEFDLGNRTLFEVITGELGLIWMGRFLGEVDDKVVKERAAVDTAQAVAYDNAPPAPKAEARTEP